MKLSEQQNARLIELLWDSMKHDPEHKDRRQTGWGTKTKIGLAACIERIINEDSQLSEAEKLRLYRANRYYINSPPVCHANWTEEDWIQYIDKNNWWLPEAQS